MPASSVKRSRLQRHETTRRRSCPTLVALCEAHRRQIPKPPGESKTPHLPRPWPLRYGEPVRVPVSGREGTPVRGFCMGIGRGMLDQLLFRRFFTSLAIAWAVGEWILACWLVPAFRALPAAPPLPLLPALAVLHRLTGKRFERETRLPAIIDRPARIIMAGGFAAAAGAG